MRGNKFEVLTDTACPTQIHTPTKKGPPRAAACPSVPLLCRPARADLLGNGLGCRVYLRRSREVGQGRHESVSEWRDMIASGRRYGVASPNNSIVCGAGCGRRQLKHQPARHFRSHQARSNIVTENIQFSFQAGETYYILID